MTREEEMVLVGQVSYNKCLKHWELMVLEEGARMGTFFSFLSLTS